MGLDLLIRNGTVVDGSGMPRYRADVGVRGGRIVEIGRIRAAAEHTVDADGLIVAPGFIDGHTHMDAQVAWDPLGSCSCWHGVTSVVMGNCGFALAPCKPDDKEWFARCLTAVEDIPTEAMLAGIDWNWETFPEYLANVERLPKAINYGMYIGHSALRMYAMGRRALDERANEDDLRHMGHAVEEAVRAGAMGLSTSRATTHVTPEGSPVASRIADWEEIDRLVGAMAALDAGIFQIGPDISGGEAQRVFLERLRRVALESGRPIMFGVLATRQGVDPNPWQYQMRYIDETAAAGGRMYGQATTRSINAVFSLKSYLPFDALPGWREIRSLPIAEQKRRLADPEVRRKLIEAEALMKPRDSVLQGGGAATTDPRKPDYTNLYPMLSVDWDDPSVADLARTRNQHPVDIIIDLALENEDRMFVQPIVNESAGGRAGAPQAPADIGDVLRFRRACVPGNGLLATDPFAELLGPQAPAVHPRRSRSHVDLRQRLGLGTARPRTGAHRLRRRSRGVRRRADQAALADRRAGFAWRRAAARPEGGRHLYHGRQWPGGLRERRGHRQFCRPGAEGTFGELARRGFPPLYSRDDGKGKDS